MDPKKAKIVGIICIVVGIVLLGLLIWFVAAGLV